VNCYENKNKENLIDSLGTKKNVSSNKDKPDLKSSQRKPTSMIKSPLKTVPHYSTKYTSLTNSWRHKKGAVIILDFHRAAV